MITFDYIKPTVKKAAIDAILKNEKAMFIAGGTNLVDLMKRGITVPEKLVDINNLELRGITRLSTGISVGALTLNSEMAENPEILQGFPLLAMALKAGASPQIRNMATAGGNMMQRTRCSYFYDTSMPCNKRAPGTGCGALKGYNRMHAIFGASENCIAVHPSDMCVALAALDAVVVVSGPKGERHIPFTAFHRLPGDHPQKDNVLENAELITSIQLKENAFSQHSYYLKVRDRASYAFALVSVAVGLDIRDNLIRDARLAMGGVAHKPWRLRSVENILKGKPVQEATFRLAAETAMQGAQAYGYNAFKLKLAHNSIIEALTLAAKA